MKKYYPGIGWAILIFVLSSISIGKSSLPDYWDLFSLDKVAHAICYFVLYRLWARGLSKDGKSQKPIYFLILVLCILYGALLELYQGYFLAFRSGNWMDGLANGIGAFVAYAFFYKNNGKQIIASRLFQE